MQFELRPLRVCLYAVACAVATGSLLLPGCRQVPASPPPAPLRLTTWNVQGCAAGLDKVIDELRRTNADVICLQEAETPPAESGQPSQPATIAERLGMRQFSAGSRLPNGNEQRMAILARNDLRECEPLEAGTQRIYGVTAVLTAQGRPVRIVCVHLTSSYRLDLAHALRTLAARNKEADDLAQRLERWKEPVLIAGDFNAVPGMKEHQRLSQVAVRATTTQPTCPSDHPILSLDHVYHSAGLRTVRREVENTSSSDHLRVVADVILDESQHAR